MIVFDYEMIPEEKQQQNGIFFRSKYLITILRDPQLDYALNQTLLLIRRYS